MSDIKRYDHVIKHPAGGGAFGFMQEDVDGGYVDYDDHVRSIRRERDKCAKLVEDMIDDDGFPVANAHKIAAAIRGEA